MDIEWHASIYRISLLVNYLCVQIKHWLLLKVDFLLSIVGPTTHSSSVDDDLSLSWALAKVPQVSLLLFAGGLTDSSKVIVIFDASVCEVAASLVASSLDVLVAFVRLGRNGGTTSSILALCSRLLVLWFLGQLCFICLGGCSWSVCGITDRLLQLSDSSAFDVALFYT